MGGNELADEDEIVLGDDAVSVAQRSLHAPHSSRANSRTQVGVSTNASSPSGAPTPPLQQRSSFVAGETPWFVNTVPEQDALLTAQILGSPLISISRARSLAWASVAAAAWMVCCASSASCI